eukprot:UN01207
MNKYCIHWNVKYEKRAKRIQFTLKNLTLDAFSKKIAEKFQIEKDSIESIHYIMYGMQDVLELEQDSDLTELIDELLDDELLDDKADVKILHFIINKPEAHDDANGGARRNNNDNKVFEELINQVKQELINQVKQEMSQIKQEMSQIKTQLEVDTKENKDNDSEKESTDETSSDSHSSSDHGVKPSIPRATFKQ